MNNNVQKGQIIILNTLMFFVLSVALIFALTSPVVSSFNITNSFSKQKQSFMLANSAINESVYKFKKQKNIISGETVSLLQGDAHIEINSLANETQILVNSDVNSYQTNYETKLYSQRGINFEYGVQTGQGGFELSGGSGVIGTVYANGKILGSGNSYITEHAISANITDPVSVISNNIGIIDPTKQINFGGNSLIIPQDVAQSFVISTTTPVSAIRVLVKKTGNPWNNIIMRIVQDDAGKPGKTELAQGIIGASVVTSTFNYITVPVTSPVILQPDMTYWIVFDTINFWGSYFSLGANTNSYSDGTAKLSQNGWSQGNGGSWNAFATTSIDAYFDVFVGGSTGLIDGVIIGSNGIGDAWSYEIKNSSIAKNAYCFAGYTNNTSCNTSRSTPVQQSFPISDEDIQSWKESAGQGISTSTLSFGWGIHALDSTKIEGNLNVNSGGILNLNGPVYVTGNITVSGGSIVQVNPTISEKSIVLVSDGKIETNSGGLFKSSGANNSYIMLVTTSSCPHDVGCSGNSAIHITGGSGAVVLNAQKGTILLDGGAHANQITAYKAIITGGSTVTYESGLQNPSFVSEYSSGWKISSWKEIE